MIGRALRNEIDVTSAREIFLARKSHNAQLLKTVVTYFILARAIIF
jgi:hypothetical protein